MVTLHPEYLVGQDKHTKAVLLPLPEWKAVVAELEELDDIRAFDETKASTDEAIPFKQAVREIRENYDA